MNAIEETGKVATATIAAMKSVPLAIALLAVNVGFLAFCGYLLHIIGENAASRDKTQTDLIMSLVKECKRTAT